MPSFDIENKQNAIVVGVDEAGRGPWAGPVVAGAVIISNQNLSEELLSQLDDSKKLSKKKRETIYQLLLEEEKNGNLHIGIGESSAQEIDDINILQATFLAMKRAVECLKIKPEIAIIDGNLKPKSFPCNAIAVVKGDSKSFSISAASIVAKVYRDKIMENIGIKYPNYGFEKHSGYGTKQHIDALKAHGVTKHHRTSYKPIKELLNK